MLDEAAGDVYQPASDVLTDRLLLAAASRTDPLGFGHFMRMNLAFDPASADTLPARLRARTSRAALSLRFFDLSFELGVFPGLRFGIELRRFPTVLTQQLLE